MQAEQVVAKMSEAGNALGDFGLSLIKLSKFEDERGVSLGAYTRQAAASKAMAADSRRTGMVRFQTLAGLAETAKPSSSTASAILIENTAVPF